VYRWFKDHFIPHEGNDHQPHFLRLRMAALLLGGFIAIELFYLAGTLYVLPRSDYFAAILASVLIDQTNEKRETGSLSMLAYNETLEHAARLKAVDMAEKGYFAHNTPEGFPPWYWIEKAGYRYISAGENLAVNFTDSNDVTEAWMRSPTHRANILNGNFTEIGIATAQGKYKGKDAIFVVQMFGRPAPDVLPPADPTPNVAAVITEASLPETKANEPTETPTIPPEPIETIALLPPEDDTGNEAPATTSTSSVVAGAEIVAAEAPASRPWTDVREVSTPSTLETFIASPRLLATVALTILMALIAAVLTLSVFVRMRIQHPHVIGNGILLIGIAVSLILFNTALAFVQGAI